MTTQTQQQTIRRGTTPDIAINVNQDLSGIKTELTIESGGYQIVHTTDDRLNVTTEQIEIEAAEGEEPTTITKCQVHTSLTQEETLALKANSKVSIQLRTYSAGVAKASNIYTLGVEDVLRNGKIS